MPTRPDERTRAFRAGQVGAGYPDAYPQPGIGGFVPEYPAGAEERLVAPYGVAFDGKHFTHQALASALGIQMALGHPHVRALIQSTLDNMLRASFKPMVLPPWVEKPFKAAYIMDVGEASVAQHASTFSTMGVSVSVPDGGLGVVKFIGLNVANAEDWQQIHYQLQVGGTPVQGLDDITCQIGSMTTPFRSTVLVPGGQTATMFARSDSGTLGGVQAFLMGWYWFPQNDGDLDNAHGNATVA